MIPRNTRSNTARQAQNQILDRLRPCVARERTMNEAGGHPTATELLKKYAVRLFKDEAKEYAETSYVKKFKKDLLAHQLRLPELAQGSADRLRNTDPSTWEFKREGIIRGQHPLPEFKQKFTNAGAFLEDQAILVVPELSNEEAKEFSENPEIFKQTKLCTEDWHDEQRVYWVLDGAHRLTLCKELGYDMYAHIISPEISYGHASFIAVNRNEGVTHISNDTVFLDKVTRIGNWADDGMTNAKINALARDWTTVPMVSQYKQCHTAIYKHQDSATIVPIVEKDLERPKDERIWNSMTFYLSKVFKYMQSYLRDGAYGNFFKEIDACKTLEALKEKSQKFGLKPTWGQQNHLAFQWLFLMRFWLKTDVMQRNAELKGEMEELNIPTETLQKHLAQVEEGKYDHFLMNQYLTRVKSNSEFKKTGGVAVEYFKDNAWSDIRRVWFQNHYKDVTSRIQRIKKKGAVYRYVPLKHCYLTTADGTNGDEWRSVLKTADIEENIDIEGEPHYVVLTSPPWGLLAKNQIPMVGTGEETETKDEGLTNIEIQNFASSMKCSLPDDATVVLHLPPSLYGTYKEAMCNNGWEAARVPITIITTGFRKSNWKSESLANNVDTFYIFHKPHQKLWKTFDSCAARYPKPVLKCLAMGGIALKDNVVRNTLKNTNTTCIIFNNRNVTFV